VALKTKAPRHKLGIFTVNHLNARHGKPVAFYSDKHTVFHVNKRSGVGGNRMTQYGHALHELGSSTPVARTKSSPASA
jgi:hypothetical protein